MKKATLVLILALAYAAPVFAATTGAAVTPSHTAPHSHEYTDKTTEAFGAGIGADVVVYKGEHPLVEEVRVDTRYDIDNSETRVFGVVRVNLFEYLQNR